MPGTCRLYLAKPGSQSLHFRGPCLSSNWYWPRTRSNKLWSGNLGVHTQPVSPEHPLWYPYPHFQVKGPNDPSMASIFLDQGFPQHCFDCPLLLPVSPTHAAQKVPCMPFPFAPPSLPTNWPRAQYSAYSRNSRNTGLINECWPCESFLREFHAKILYSIHNP